MEVQSPKTSVANDHELLKHTFDRRQTILPSIETHRLWAVKFDADGKVLKRHEHDDDVDPRDSIETREIHAQRT